MRDEKKKKVLEDMGRYAGVIFHSLAIRRPASK